MPELSDTRCHHVFADNRRCLMPMSDCPEGLCLHHLRQLRGMRASERAEADLLGSIQDLNSPTEINHALGKVFKLLASNRITPRNAGVLAYICQLSLITLPQVRDMQVPPVLEKIVAQLLQGQELNVASPAATAPRNSATVDSPVSAAQQNSCIRASKQRN